jgi:hypothetical protein
MIEVLKQMIEALEWCHGGEPIGTAEAIQAGKQAIAELESQDHIEQHLEMVKQKHKNNIWAKQLSAAQRNELSQIEDGTWEADRNG